MPEKKKKRRRPYPSANASEPSKLKELREELGLEQQEVADACKICVRTLRNAEKGNNILEMYARSIARIYKKPADELFDFAKDRGQIQGKEMENPEYSKILGDAIKDANNPNTLMGSVGEADFALSFITRQFVERENRGLSKPSISRVILKRLSNRLVKTKIMQKALDPEFGTKLDWNLKQIKKTLNQHNIELQVLNWESFPPPFHGWIYGNHVFQNSWEGNAAGVFHVKTVLRHYTRAGSLQMWQDSIKAFDADK
jgi:transcriptional regulator with XRE-family HTH domain